MPKGTCIAEATLSNEPIALAVAMPS